MIVEISGRIEKLDHLSGTSQKGVKYDFYVPVVNFGEGSIKLQFLRGNPFQNDAAAQWLGKACELSVDIAQSPRGLDPVLYLVGASKS